MKRLITIFILTVLLSSCVPRDEVFSEAMNNMNELSQLKMVITINGIPVIENITGTLTIDNDKSESLIIGSRSYTYVEDNVEYYIKEYGDVFYRFSEQDNQENYFKVTSYSNFKFEDFEFSDGYYVSNKTIDGMDDIYIKIKNGYIDTLQFKIESEGSELDVKVEFVNYGTAIITLPEFTILSELEEAMFVFTLYGYTYTEVSTGYVLVSEDLTIEYKTDETFYTIITEDGNFEYYPETKYVFLDTNVSLALEIYLDYEDHPIISIEEFESLDNLYLLE